MEMYSFLLDLPEARKGKHLKSAGIRQNRLVPYHKLMQPSKFFYHLIARSYVEMIGIGKLHLGFDLS